MEKQYRYDNGKSNFEFQAQEKDQSTRKAKVIQYQESAEVRNEHVFQQMQNDLYEKIENGECFNVDYIEMVLLKNLLWKYNRTQVSKITGLCVRTVRNKINKYGLGHIRLN